MCEGVGQMCEGEVADVGRKLVGKRFNGGGRIVSGVWRIVDLCEVAIGRVAKARIYMYTCTCT